MKFCVGLELSLQQLEMIIEPGGEEGWPGAANTNTARGPSKVVFPALEAFGREVRE